MTASHSVFSAAGILLAALLSSGCSAAEVPPEEPNANWSLLGRKSPAPQDTTLQLGVVRAACAGGETGDVASTDTEFGTEQVVVTVYVQPLPEGAYDCPMNDTVPYILDLGQPLGERALVDGACRDAALSGTPACSQEGLRWKP